MTDEFELISRSSRAEAIAGGLLIDVTATAKSVGIAYPTAVTKAVFEKYVRVPDNPTDQDEPDAPGRLRGLLSLLLVAIRQSQHTDPWFLTVAMNPSERAGVPSSLRAIGHPGDEAEPVITILLPATT